jgi:hypothetical protein
MAPLVQEGIDKLFDSGKSDGPRLFSVSKPQIFPASKNFSKHWLLPK